MTTVDPPAEADITFAADAAALRPAVVVPRQPLAHDRGAPAGPGEFAGPACAPWLPAGPGEFAEPARAPGGPAPQRWPPRPLSYTPRRDAGLYGYERVLVRAGLAPVCGVDEAGRGACAGPLVVAAVVLQPADRTQVAGLADSKALTPALREQVYRDVVAHALAWHAVVVPPDEIDRLGLHVCNVVGMRRAVAGVSCRIGYVLTDGFAVSGLPAPALAMWKGDQVAACVAAASIVAKVTRDRLMVRLHDRYPVYDFAEHKGYATQRHAQALADHGPCPEHRFSYVNVAGGMRPGGGAVWWMPDNEGGADGARVLDAAWAPAAADGRGAAAGTGDAAGQARAGGSCGAS